jgi:hypothetical protein
MQEQRKHCYQLLKRLRSARSCTLTELTAVVDESHQIQRTSNAALIGIPRTCDLALTHVLIPRFN